MRRMNRHPFTLLFFVVMASAVSLSNARSEPFRVQSNPNATFNDKSFNPNAIRRITPQTCEQRWDQSKSEVWNRTWVYRKDISDFLELAYQDCPFDQIPNGSEACKTETEKMVSGLVALGWDYFSKICEVKPDPNGNTEKDILNCENELKSNYPSNVAGLLSHEIVKADAAKSPIYYQLFSIMKPRQMACNCGNGFVDPDWEECDPGEKGKGSLCTADCKYLTVPTGLNALKNPSAITTQRTIKLFPDLVDQ